MAAVQAYNNMLKRYLDQEMLTNEFASENYIYKKMQKDLTWKGGVYEVPVEDGVAGNIASGQLVDDLDISMGKYSLGTIAKDKELWGALKVLESDMSRHTSSKVSYLEKILPDKVDAMIKRFKEQFNAQVLTTGALATLTANGTVGGVIVVDRPELFTLNQMVEVFNGSASVKGFIKSIDMNTGSISLVTTNAGATALDVSAYTTALKSVVRIFGTASEALLSMYSAIFPLSMGGLDTLYTLPKAGSPALQATYKNWATGGEAGQTVTASNIMDQVLKFWYQLRQQGRAQHEELLVSYPVFRVMAQKLELNRRYQVTNREPGYGFESVSFIGPEGDVKVTALKRMSNTEIYAVDWSGVKFAGSAMFETVKDPNGNRFFMQRKTTGYEYTTDVKLAGDMVYQPSKLAGIKIDASVSA